MELAIIKREELEELIARAIQKATPQQPTKEEPPQNIGAEQARELLAEIWGSPVSLSLFYKLSHRGVLPKARIGKRLIFQRSQLIEYAESRITRPFDSVSESVTKAARKLEVG